MSIHDQRFDSYGCVWFDSYDQRFDRDTYLESEEDDPQLIISTISS